MGFISCAPASAEGKPPLLLRTVCGHGRRGLSSGVVSGRPRTACGGLWSALRARALGPGHMCSYGARVRCPRRARGAVGIADATASHRARALLTSNAPSPPPLLNRVPSSLQNFPPTSPSRQTKNYITAGCATSRSSANTLQIPGCATLCGRGGIVSTAAVETGSPELDR